MGRVFQSILASKHVMHSWRLSASALHVMTMTHTHTHTPLISENPLRHCIYLCMTEYTTIRTNIIMQQNATDFFFLHLEGVLA